MSQQTVVLESLGRCEHCQVLLTLKDLPADALDAEWRCPSCNGKLSHLSFGYDKGGKGAQKVKWVGPDGKWANQKPDDNFALGDRFVSSLPIQPLW